MAEETLTTNANEHHDAFTRGESKVPWALSVFSHPSEDVSGICRVAWPILNHNQVRVSIAGDLRKLGYDVIPEGKKGHCLIPLNPPPWDWRVLREDAFGPAQLNPEKQRRKKEAK